MRLLQKRLAEIRAGKHAPAAEKVTLVQLQQLVLNDFEANQKRGLRRIRLVFQHISAYFGPEVRAVDITPGRLRAYHRDRLDQGVAAATVSLEFSVLKRGSRLAKADGFLQVLPVFPVVRVSNARQS